MKTKISPDVGKCNDNDANNNLISQSGGGGSLVKGDGFFREYDGLGQLIRVRNGSNSSAPILEEYSYDPFGERIKIKRYDSANTTIYTPFKEFLMLKNKTGTYNYTYIYLENALVAEIISEPTSQVVADGPEGDAPAPQPAPIITKLYILTDHLGSTTVITNASGKVVDNITYSPYGVMIDKSNEKRLYTGQQYDSLTLEYYFGSRYYNPFIQIFTSADPEIQNVYDSQALNHYSYARNNPYTFIDPDGKNYRVYIDRDAAGGAGHMAVAVDSSKTNREVLFENRGIPEKVGGYEFTKLERNILSMTGKVEAVTYSNERRNVKNLDGTVNLPEGYDDYYEVTQDAEADERMRLVGYQIQAQRWLYDPEKHSSLHFAQQISAVNGNGIQGVTTRFGPGTMPNYVFNLNKRHQAIKQSTQRIQQEINKRYQKFRQILNRASTTRVKSSSKQKSST